MHKTKTGLNAHRLSRMLVAAGVAMASVPLLAGTSSADDFSNTAAIVIPGSGPPAGCPDPSTPENNSCPPTAASPYPSPIAVSGLTGTITDVNVTLKGLTHDSPADLDVMLEAPDKTTVMLMSDACGADNGQNPITAGIDLTFDDGAAGALPADTACSAGSFKPVDDDDDPYFQFTRDEVFPGPTLLTPGPAAASGALLSGFNGRDPNGTWNLWVVDDYPGTQGVNSGQFAGGWVLSVATPNTAPNTTSTVATTGTTTTTTTAAAAGTTTTTVAAGGSVTTTTRAANVAGRSAQAGPATLPRTGPDADNLALVRLAGLLIAGGLLLSLLTQPKTTPAGRRRHRR